MTRHAPTIVEVGPRDGFQSMKSFVPTTVKIDVMRRLYAAGVRRIEATSFVSGSAVPQFSDATDVLAALADLPGLDAQALVPTQRHAERALRGGARHLVFVLSVSRRHNEANVQRTPAESVLEYRNIVRHLPLGVAMRLNVATAFDCPYEGDVDPAATIDLLDELAEIMPDAEIGLCDTTGKASPTSVAGLFEAAFARFPGVGSWAFHGHDTYGVAAASAFAAWRAGVSVFDASLAGLGGCPFAPGATGNAATEDLVWMFEAMGLRTGIDIDALVAVASTVSEFPDAQSGGRVRHALTGSRGRPGNYT